MTSIYQKSYQITSDQAASVMGSGDLSVLATPAVVALMENAASSYSQEVLVDNDHETTVGARIEVNHLKASPVQGSLQVIINQVNQKGRHIHFELEAYVEDHLVASGSHERVIVDSQRFLGKMADTFNLEE